MNMRRDIIRFLIVLFLIVLVIAMSFSGATAEKGPRNDVPAKQEVPAAANPQEAALLLDEVSNTTNKDAIQQDVSAAENAELEKVFAPVNGILAAIFVVSLLFWLSRQQGPTIHR